MTDSLTKIALLTMAAGLAGAGCRAQTVVNTDGEGSEVATSVVGGALNSTTGSAVAVNGSWQRHQRGTLEKLIDLLSPVRPAWAATWSCTGGSLAPTFSGPGADPYAYTPMSCMVTWKNGKTASSSWSGAFSLSYGSSCDDSHAFIESQTTACTLTRTTGTTPNTRTVTGPDGKVYAVTHDTNGAATGWDSTVVPAPNNNGVVLTCASGGCATGLNIAVNGSHITGAVTAAGGSAEKFWDHTVSTGTSGITVTGAGANRVATGSITVQHNLAKFTSTTTFNNVAFGDTTCCFPTGGNVTTSFEDGPDVNKTETLTFGGGACGEAALTAADGTTSAVTLQHCL
jgi:hypothetical protein